VFHQSGVSEVATAETPCANCMMARWLYSHEGKKAFYQDGEYLYSPGGEALYYQNGNWFFDIKGGN
jgi:hypothetical protein